ANSADDKLIPHIVWQNLHPLLEDRGGELVKIVDKAGTSPNLAKMLHRAVDRLLGARKPDIASAIALVDALSDGKHPSACADCCGAITARLQTGEIAESHLTSVKEKMRATVTRLAGSASDPGLKAEAAFLAAALGDPAGIESARKVFAAANQNETARI